MRTYEQMKAFISAIPTIPDKTHYEPGPNPADVPKRQIVLTRYGGPGEDLEGVTDRISWQVRVIGKQGDGGYNDAEAIADAIDIALLSVHSHQDGTEGVISIQRVGGAPNPLEKDNAERTHFICSYIVETALALAN